MNISEYKTVTFMTAYVPGRVDFINELEMIKQDLPKPIIFTGDLYAHHTNWGNKNINRRDLQLQDMSRSRNRDSRFRCCAGYKLEEFRFSSLIR